MNKRVNKQIRECIERVKYSGSELEAVRRKELAEFDHAANWHLVDGLLDTSTRRDDNVDDNPENNGMVEMQRWFMKLAEKEGLLPQSVKENPAEYKPNTRKKATKKNPARRVRKISCD